MAKTTFPVTITGMNITERGVEGKYGPQDKVGITIQETNVIDENGQNVVVPVGAWLNGFTPQGKMDAVSVGMTIPIQIRTKDKGDGTFYYNFGYYPKDVAPMAANQVAPAAVAPAAVVAAPQLAQAAVVPEPEYVTRAEFNTAVVNLQEQIDEAHF